jgi:hypothetical protein
MSPNVIWMQPVTKCYHRRSEDASLHMQIIVRHLSTYSSLDILLW